MYTLHKISRRGLLGASGAAVLLGLGSRSLLAQTPSRGGDLTIAAPGGSTGNTLDPRSFNSPYMAIVSGTIFNTLVEATGLSLDIQPGLASSWEESEAGKVWRFNLVTNATFHNGQAMTSADVIFSMMWHLSEGSRSNARGIVGPIESIVADGDHAIVVTLRSPNYYFPAALSNYSLVIIPDGTTTFDGVGTGPYRVTNFVPGEILEAERFDGYFKENKAFVDTVTLLVVNDPNARVSAIQTGQAQISTLLDARSVSLLQSLPNIDIVFNPSRGFSGINMMLTKPPFDNLRLRQALKHAINREDVIERIYYGQARLGNDTPVPPSVPDFAASVPQTMYDPDRARALYAESGHSGPLLLQTSDAAGPGAVDLATLFKEHAAAAGIDIQVQREPADGYWGNIWAQTPFHSTVWGSRPTSDLINTIAYGSGSPANDTGFSDPEFDAAIQTARGSSNAEERMVASARAQAILSERGGVIIPAFENTPEGISMDLGGYEVGAMQVGSLRAAENVWFE